WTRPVPESWTQVPLQPNPGAPESSARQSRRLTVDQLRRSIPALFGGITWTVPARPQPVAGFDALASTLGEPDYIQATTNNLDPSPLFAKFMDDMAASVCRQALDRDATGESPALVLQHPSNPQENLRFLRLKLHGIHVAPDSMEGLEDLYGLYTETLATAEDPAQAWWAVCIAMLTAPEMMAY
ncbi:unnamed protein product, partial [Laminaria digitata]